MRPFALLKCLGKALIRHAGRAVGAAWAGDLVVQVGAEVWNEWHREKNEAERRAELQAIAQAAAQENRAQVEAVVREVAGVACCGISRESCRQIFPGS